VKSGWRQADGGLPRIFWALWTAMLVNRIGTFAMMSLPLYLKQGRVSRSRIW
jgi:hypothetical protein